MNGLFSSDSPFNVFMTLVFDIVILSVLWILTSIPLITIGASSSAMYAVMLRRVRNDEGYIVKGFFKAFKDNFRESLPAALLYVLLIAVLIADLLILRGWQSPMRSLAEGLYIAVYIIFVAIYSYVWPLIARFQNSFGRTMNNAWRIAMARLPKTLLLVLLNTLPTAVAVFLPGVFGATVIFWILFGPGLIAWFCSKLINPIFDELEEQSSGD